jgi:ATP-dependent RNA helicase DeaD
MEKNYKFSELGLSEEMLEVIKQKGFEKPSPIQVLTIPILLKNEKDIIGQAQTGTGKTAAFGLPIIENTRKDGITQVLVLAPTRELAIQVAEELTSLRINQGINILPVYGGQSIEGQLRRLKKGVEIVVGTPGRILDHLKRGTLLLNNLSYLVLDEADEMLNMGFIEDIEKILSTTNADKRMLLFSATMPAKIVKLAQKFMGEFTEIKVSPKTLTVDLTDQIYFEVNSSDKFEALCRIIDIETEFYALIFCRTKLKAQHLGNALSDRGYDAAALHGDISQNQRERILDQFRKKRISILAATDVAARGNGCEKRAGESAYHRRKPGASSISDIGEYSRYFRVC